MCKINNHKKNVQEIAAEIWNLEQKLQQTKNKQEQITYQTQMARIVEILACNPAGLEMLCEVYEEIEKLHKK